jgi:hypothetical protein
VRERSSGLKDLGPPPKSSVDWFFTRRPGRILDAAELEPADPKEVERELAERRQRKGVTRVFSSFFSFLRF